MCVLGETGMVSLEPNAASDPEMLQLKYSPLQIKSLCSLFFKKMDEIAQRCTDPHSVQLKLPIYSGSLVTPAQVCPSWARDVKQQSSVNEKKIDSY